MTRETRRFARVLIARLRPGGDRGLRGSSRRRRGSLRRRRGERRMANRRRTNERERGHQQMSRKTVTAIGHGLELPWECCR